MQNPVIRFAYEFAHSLQLGILVFETQIYII